MNKTVTASEANRSFSKLLGEVDNGHEITVTNHGRVVARIVPPKNDIDDRAAREKAWRALMDRLAKQPAMNGDSWKREELYEDIPE